MKAMNKGSKKWLWLAIAVAVVLAVVGIVLGIALSGLSEEGPSADPDNTPKGGRPELYWNIDRALYSDATTGMSAREPDADGKYRVTFAYEGEQKVYVISDKRLVNYVDTVDAMGLVFGENGEVIDILAPTDIAKELAKNFTVVKVEGNVITLNGSENLDGMVKQITCENVTKIFDLACERESKGQIIQTEDLRPLDNVVVYGNDLDQPTHIGLMSTPVESAIYWRIQQFYDYSVNVRSTTRQPDENGIYTVEMFCNGEIVPVKFKVKDAVSEIDKATGDIAHFGIVFDEDGYGIAVQPSKRGIRGKLGCSLYDVTEINGAAFTAAFTSGGETTTYSNTLGENVPVYDISADGRLERRGKAVEGLQVGDRITVWEDTLGNIVEIYIYNRLLPNCKIAFRTDSRGANRQPDANGWYTIELFDGESVKLYKTKDERLCRLIETSQFFAMKAEGNVVKDVYDTIRVLGNRYLDYPRYNYSVASMAGVVVTLLSPNGNTMDSRILASNCKVYNMSGVDQEIGTETTIRAGDRGWFLLDSNGQIAYAFLSNRKVDGEVYYNINTQYNTVTKTTTREPDDNGWYVYTMAHKGKLVTIKTKSKAIATKMDKNALLGLNPNSKGIVTDAYSATSVTGGQTIAGNNWAFECMTEDGKIQLYDALNPESKYYITPAEGMETYNVSSVGFKKFRGEADTVEKGDFVFALTDGNNKAVILYITGQSYESVTKKCDHCNKKVTFKPWTGTNLSLLQGASGHYYIPGNAQGFDYNLLGDVKFEENNDIVIDLNGKTVEFAEGKRGFFVYNTVTMSIMDSVGGGRMIATGEPGQGGGLFAVAMKGKLNIYGGSLELAKKHSAITDGGVISVGGAGAELNFYGGKLVSHDSKMEALSAGSGTINMHSGVVIDGGMRISNQTAVNMEGTVKISKLEITRKGTLVDFTKLNSKSSIGIVASGVFTTEMSDPNALLKIFNSPVKGGKIVVEGKQLACYGAEPDYNDVYEQSVKMDFSNTEKLPKTCPYCDRSVIWEPLPKLADASLAVPGGKHYYLPKGGITVNYQYMIDGGNVCLHLNGQTLSSEKVEPITVFYPNTLTIMGDGIIQGGGTSEAGRTASTIANNGTVNLCGGKLMATGKGNMPIIANRGNQEDNAINVYDGTVQAKGVAIKVRSKTLTVSGGTINGAVSTEAGAKVAITGGKIQSVKLAKDTALQLSGVPVIDKLTITKGVLVQVGEMKSGAKIGVDADGIFTTEFASDDAATAALAYFKIAEEGAVLRTEGKALYCEPAPFDFKQVISQANAMTFPTDSSTYTADCPFCEETVQWTPLSTVVDRYSETNKRYEQYLYNTRHYYADKNFDLTNGAIINVTDTATCVHLNNKTISAEGSSVFSNAMNLMGQGTVKVVAGGNVSAPATVLAPGGYTMNICGGTYTTASDVTLRDNGAVFMYHGGTSGKATVNFYGGQIDCTNNDAVKIYSGATFNMYGGKITGAPLNLYFFGTGAAAYANVYDGQIEKLGANEGYLNIQGGTIGKVDVTRNLDGIAISGAPVISNLNMKNAAVKAEIGELTTGAQIKVNANGIFTQAFADEDAAKAALAFFGVVEEGAAVRTEGAALYCEPAPYNYQAVIDAANAITFPTDGADYTADCPVCEQRVTWKAITGPTYGLESGHYYLANDVVKDSSNALEGTLYLNNAKGADICLHINGKTLENTDGVWPAIRIWSTGNNLTLMGSGTVRNNSANWGAVHVTPNIALNVYGSSFYNNTGNKNAIAVQSGTTNIYGATVEKGRIFANGGAVNVYGGNCETMVASSASAAVTLNEATFGTVKATAGSPAIKGGNIGTLVVTDVTDMTLSGKLVINELDVTSAATLLTVSKLESGSNIKVKANIGVFTKDFADTAAAEAAKTFFSATAKTKEIKVEGKALACAGVETSPYEDEIEKGKAICDAARAMRFEGTASVSAVCPACGGAAVAWQPLTPEMLASSNTYSGHYFLTEDYTKNGTIIVNGTNLCLHLNGKKLIATGGTTEGAIKVVNDSNVFNVFDNGNGLVDGGSAAAAICGWRGTMNIYGGTFTSSYSNGNLGAWNVRWAKMNLYGGTVNLGAQITLVETSAALNVYGGQIQPIGSYAGALIHAKNNLGQHIGIHGGTVNGQIKNATGHISVTGGNIASITGSSYTQSIELTFNPVIQVLDMTDVTVKVAVNKLVIGASVGVKADGVFTGDVVDVSLMKPFFSAVVSGKEIAIVGQALSCTDKP